MSKVTRNLAAILATHNIDPRKLTAIGYETAKQLAVLDPKRFHEKSGEACLAEHPYWMPIPGGDMWRQRSHMFLRFLAELLDHHFRGHYGPRDVLQMLDVISPTGLRRLIKNAHSLGAGVLLAHKTRVWIDSVPGLCDHAVRDGRWSEKAKEQVQFLILPLISHFVEACAMTGAHLTRNEVKDLAHELARLGNLKLAEAYELASELAGFQSWNHFSAELSEKHAAV